MDKYRNWVILVAFEIRLTGIDLENLKQNQIGLEHFLQAIKVQFQNVRAAPSITHLRLNVGRSNGLNMVEF